MNWEDSDLQSQKHNFYFTKVGDKNYNGMYAPGLDRWLLIDKYDFWVTFQAAQVLSSKIPIMVYILPPDLNGMNNVNCLNFGIFDKTKQIKLVTSPDLSFGQMPALRVLIGENQIRHFGPQADFISDERAAALTQLKDFASYIQECMYAALLCNASTNYFGYREFAHTFIPEEWTKDLYLHSDRSDISQGVLHTIKNILYTSITITEAKDRISKLFEDNFHSLHWFIPTFDRLLK
jgi:hypothetical protein